MVKPEYKATFNGGIRMKKSIEEWLKGLPDGYRERALAQMRPIYSKVLMESMASAINGFAAWRGTEEGHAFWDAVFEHYTPPPPPPHLPQLPTTEVQDENSN